MIDERLVFTNLEVNDFSTTIQKMGSKMKNLGYVEDTFIDAVITRENSFPTGLELADYSIAIPHTDPEHVRKSAIAIATLSQPVAVNSMIDPQKSVEVSFIVLMAIKDPKGQLAMLSKLMGFFQDVETLKQLEAAQEKEEIIHIINGLELTSC